MKVVILAGGYGTRISEESVYRPKPMVEICGMPILWHIMKYYSSYGFNDFIICCGYKQYVIKEWFADYYLHTSDVTFDFTADNKMTVHTTHTEPWKVTLVDTGLNTMTGGRIKRVGKFIGDEPFMLTYGDGVSDVDLDALLKFHQEKGQLATITAARVDQRFGCVDIDAGGNVSKFREKDVSDSSVVNAGFMVLEPKVLDYIDGDEMPFEKAPLERIAAEGELNAYIHNGFWQCMDTKRDKEQLEALIKAGKAPRIKWED
jgi:glucose-1-phosphate cytidylyltransferase